MWAALNRLAGGAPWTHEPDPADGRTGDRNELLTRHQSLRNKRPGIVFFGPFAVLLFATSAAYFTFHFAAARPLGITHLDRGTSLGRTIR